MKKPEKTITPEQAFAQMARLCSRKECCIWDVRRKLQRLQIQDESAERVIDQLKKDRYIDEARYVRNYIHDKSAFNKWGKVKIVLSLRQKQIPAEVIDAALAEFSDTALNAPLLQLMEAKRKTVKGGSAYEINGKLIRYALGKGYPMKEILNCMQKMDMDELPYETE
jgi:regulatory protein